MTALVLSLTAILATSLAARAAVHVGLGLVLALTLALVALLRRHRRPEGSRHEEDRP